MLWGVEEYESSRGGGLAHATINYVYRLLAYQVNFFKNKSLHKLIKIYLLVLIFFANNGLLFRLY